MSVFLCWMRILEMLRTLRINQTLLVDIYFFSVIEFFKPINIPSVNILPMRSLVGNFALLELTFLFKNSLVCL